MKLILVAITIALLGGCLNALPTGDAEDDFTIDMYSNEGHLRVARSTEAKAGTTVTIEKAAETKDAAAAAPAADPAAAPATAEAKTTVESKESLKIEDALNLVKKTVQKLESENSAVETQQVSTKIETAKQQQQQQAQKQEEKQVESITTSVSAISAPKSPVVGQIETNDEATFSAYSQKYVNPYGDVLNRINKDRVRQLASSSSSGRRDAFERPSSSYQRDNNRDSRYNRPQTRTLSSPSGMAPKFGQGISKSQSSVFINGQKVEGDGLNSFAPGKKFSPYSRYSANPYGDTENLSSRQRGRNHHARPLSAQNNVRVLSFQPPQQPRYF